MPTSMVREVADVGEAVLSLTDAGGFLRFKLIIPSPAFGTLPMQNVLKGREWLVLI